MLIETKLFAFLPYCFFGSSIDLLLSKGANLNAKDNSGCTVVDDVALGRSEPGVFEFLLSKGAEANNIHFAAYQGDVDRVETFLREGVDVNERARPAQIREARRAERLTGAVSGRAG